MYWQFVIFDTWTNRVQCFEDQYRIPIANREGHDDN